MKSISQCIKSDLRTLEKLEKKFILNKLHLEFNEISINTYIDINKNTTDNTNIVDQEHSYLIHNTCYVTNMKMIYMINHESSYDLQ